MNRQLKIAKRCPASAPPLDSLPVLEFGIAAASAPVTVTASYFLPTCILSSLRCDSRTLCLMLLPPLFLLDLLFLGR